MTVWNQNEYSLVFSRGVGKQRTIEIVFFYRYYDLVLLGADEVRLSLLHVTSISRKRPT